MNTEKFWYALEINAVSEASEAIEFALNELDALGTEINNLGKNQIENIIVKGYFQEIPNDETVRSQINEALRIYNFAPDAVREIDARRVENADWLAEWKKHWKPTETEKFIVAPTWENVETSDKIVIRIEPQMAFGTGTHETTRLCLQAIEKYYASEMSFLDVGTGTGILAIAAAKLQPEIKNQKSKIKNPFFTAYDTDRDSIANAEENAALNEIGDSINFRVGSISADDAIHDFVCANITVDVIAPLLPLLIEKSKRVLALSGILHEQQEFIVAQLKIHGIENFEIESLGEWISLIIQK